ncbi:hypothetical protein D9X91_19860 [Falsibacillus albus]|uniref:Uncharacterized protein n=1 Tax=Falsibacillus albus TaxID=2478915 RepID=A0A3L7JPC7_9BACI|nr:hypothetical protein D9X91_19860 [Falsibacillus albus]
MTRVKVFFKKDSDILRDIILFVIGFSFGFYKLFFQHSHLISSKIQGGVLLVAAVTFLIPQKDKRHK